MEDLLVSTVSKRAGLLALRVTVAGLMFWWGLAKGLNTGVGQAVSESFYGGAFSVDTLLIGDGWLQVAAAILIAAGLLRRYLLPLQLIVNTFVASTIWWAFIDPFWLWMDGARPFQFPQLFYPSIIIVAASWLLIAFRDQDTWALDEVLARR
jgi:uncharacterized membrane protein YphA (DoxX/SURF4 family)